MPIRMDKKMASSPEALVKLGRALMGSGQGNKAVEIFRALRAERPDDDGGPRRRQACLHVRSGSGGRRDRPRDRGGQWICRSYHRHCAPQQRARSRARSCGGADIIVSEIIADDLLSEGVIVALDHAARELARPGAKFIPCKASMRVALAWFDQQQPELPAVVNGFDVSLFERHVATHHSVLVGHKRLHLRSDARDLFRLGFGGGAPAAPTRDDALLQVRQAPVNGLVQWVHLQMDEAEAYENAPATEASSAWGAVLHRFTERTSPALLPLLADVRLSASGSRSGEAAATDSENLLKLFRSDLRQQPVPHRSR